MYMQPILVVFVLLASVAHNRAFYSKYLGLTSSRTLRSDIQILRNSKKTDEEIREQLKQSLEDTSFKSPESLRDFALLDKELMISLRSKRPYFSLIVEQFIQSFDDNQLTNKLKNAQLKSECSLESATQYRNRKRPRIVILGAGWGAYSFLKTIDTTLYDVTIVSPRNYFVFTPMLAASSVGTVEFRSITEPIRNVNPLADYLETQATTVDTDKKVVYCESVKCEGTACDVTDFEVAYDHLVVTVGATTNTFGVKGVREHCLFLKQVEDAASLRKAICYCFERANVPSLTEEEKRSTLSFVVVGAGPTGVEFTAELRDFLETEGRRYYPTLLRYCKITLVEASGAVLQVLDETLQKEALAKLRDRKTTLIQDGFIERELVEVVLETGVREVTDTAVQLSTNRTINYGFCLWAAGNGPVPLVLDMVEKIPAQKAQQSKARGRLVTDAWLRVRGAGQVYALGDCSYIEDGPLPATAQVAAQQGGYLGRLFSRAFDMTSPVPVRSQSVASTADRTVDYETAPLVFASEVVGVGAVGTSVSRVNNSTGSTESETDLVVAKPFQFLNLGVLAYIGASEALSQVSVDSRSILGTGPIGFLLWRGIYWSKQVSWRSRLLVSFDWLKCRLFGRDLGALYL